MEEWYGCSTNKIEVEDGLSQEYTSNVNKACKVGFRMDKMKRQLIGLATNMEMVLALCIIIAMAIGFVTIVGYFFDIAGSHGHDTYETIKEFLAMALLVAIGLELVLMLLSHSTSSILELVLFAIARKLLIYSQTMMDVLIGTAAILIIFFIRKYLMSAKYALKEGRIISAASPIHALNLDTELSMPENRAVTIGGLICRLSEESLTPIEEGAEFTIGGVMLRILKMRDGVIEQVSIVDKGENRDRH